MSGTGVYQYTSDNGTIYQVVLSSDFAAALGYSAAIGSEPYLPASITPRYATYASFNPTITLQAVVPTRKLWAGLPRTVSVNGVVYQLASQIGENRVPLTLGNIMLAMGPQGPKGDAGVSPVISTSSGLLSADFALTTTNALIGIASLSLAAGTYLLVGSVQFETGSGSAATFTAAIQRTTGSSVLVSGSQRQPNTTMWTYITVATLLTLTATETVYLAAMSDSAGTTAKRNSQFGTQATQIEAVRLGT